MTVRHGVLGEPHLQGAGEASRGMLDEMRQPIARNRLLPMAQDFPGGWIAGTQTAHDIGPCLRNDRGLQLDRPRRN